MPSKKLTCVTLLGWRDFLTPPCFATPTPRKLTSPPSTWTGMVEMVDATGFIATKAKFHGAQWPLGSQGAFFDEADQLFFAEWTTDALAYDGLTRSPRRASVPCPRRMPASRTACWKSATSPAVTLRTPCSADQVHRRLHLEWRQLRQRHDGPNRLHEANLSGEARAARLDKTSFESRNLTAASTAPWCATCRSRTRRCTGFRSPAPGGRGDFTGTTSTATSPPGDEGCGGSVLPQGLRDQEPRPRSRGSVRRHPDDAGLRHRDQRIPLQRRPPRKTRTGRIFLERRKPPTGAVFRVRLCPESAS